MDQKYPKPFKTAIYNDCFDPLVGFFHRPAFGRESLACDIVEPLRPRIDEWVWQLFRTRLLRTDSFVEDKGAVLRQCLSALSTEHREIIDLVYYHEKSVEEVAGIVGIPEATVKTRMFYARKKLSELLKERGIDRGWP